MGIIMAMGILTKINHLMEKIMGDLPNFTNIEPVVQISEVLA